MKKYHILSFILIALLFCSCGKEPAPKPEPQSERVAPSPAQTKEAKRAARPPIVIPPSMDIWASAASGDVAMILKHVEIGTDLNAPYPAKRFPGTGGSPLHLAAFAGMKKSIQPLVDNGADLNGRASDAKGGTPLHWAIGMARIEMVEALLAAGADINAGDANGLTPLDATFVDPLNGKMQKLEIAKFLVAKGGKRKADLK